MSESNNQMQVFQKPKALMEYLEKGRGSIAAALPKHLNPDRMLRLAVTAFSQTPKLRECTGQSILASIIVASQLGLEPGILGQAYLVPYKTTCQLVPGWQGIVSLLNNTGRATAWTGTVYEGDKFVYALGSAPRIEHEPGENFGDPDKITHFYACGKVNGAELPVIECWTKKRVEKHRDKYNKVGKAHYSFQHFEMYGRKVVLLQVLKYMPKTIELSNAMEVANANESNRFARMEDGIVIVDEAQDDPGTAGQGQAPQGLPPAQTQAKPAAPAAEQQQPVTPTSPGQQLADDQLSNALLELRKEAGISEDEITAFAVRNGMLEKEKPLSAITLKNLRRLVEGWIDVKDLVVAARSSTP